VLPTFMVGWSALVILPLLIMAGYSFLQVRSYRVVYQPSFATWISLVESGRWIAIVRTLRVAFTITVIEFLLAFPFAIWLAKICRSKPLKALIVTLLTIPFFLDASSRMIVWRAILGNAGVVNTLLLHAGVIDQPIKWLLFSEFAVHFGMIGSYFPTMLFPIYLVLTLIDDEYFEASADLGASPLQTLVRITLPLALPGIVAGFVFTLVPLMAAFVEPQMLGFSVDSALRELKYPTAAALSTVVVVMLALLLLLLVAITRRRMDIASVFQAIRR